MVAWLPEEVTAMAGTGATVLGRRRLCQRPGPQDTVFSVVERMTVEQLTLDGSPMVGVYICTSEDVVLVPKTLDRKAMALVCDVLKAEPIGLALDGSPLVGSLAAMNTKGVVITNMASKEELAALSRRFNIVKTPDGLNAAGNNILCNDVAAMVNPDYSRKMVSKMADALGVEVVKGTVGGVRTVGSAAVATNTGILCHPKASEQELTALRELFKVNVQIGTANYGNAMVGAAVVANTKGAIAGSMSTGIELGRIEDALGYLDRK